MITVEVSTAAVKGKLFKLFQQIDGYTRLMDQQRALSADKARVIKLRPDDYNAMMRLAKEANWKADYVTHRGYPVQLIEGEA